MATEKQREFVNDIESAVMAIMSKNPDANGVTIAEVMDMSERKSNDLAGLVIRLADGGEWPLLDRIKAAFDKVKISSLALDRALSRRDGKSGDEFRLENSLPEPRNDLRSADDIPRHASKPEKDDADVLRDILKMLDSRSAASKRRIGGMIMQWCEVGA